MKLAVLSLKGAEKEGTTVEICKAGKQFFDEVKAFVLSDAKVEVHAGTFIDSLNLEEFDCIYLRGSYKYSKLLTSIALSIEGKVYMPLKPESFLIAHDKFLTLQYLHKAKVPVPLTYLIYNTQLAKEVLDRFVYPVVFKLPEGTQGKGVIFADTKESASSIIDMLDKFGIKPFFIEEYIETGATDIRAFVIGNEVFAMKRIAKPGELRANIHAGGIGKPIELDWESKQIAIKAVRACGMQIGAADLLQTKHKTYVVEVNASPSIIGISKALNKNLAQFIAKFLHEKTKEFKGEQKESRYKEMKQKIKSYKAGTELIVPLDIKGSAIKLPPQIMKIINFSPADEVAIKADDGYIELKRIKLS